MKTDFLPILTKLRTEAATAIPIVVSPIALLLHVQYTYSGPFHSCCSKCAVYLLSDTFRIIALWASYYNIVGAKYLLPTNFSSV